MARQMCVKEGEGSSLKTEGLERVVEQAIRCSTIPQLEDGCRQRRGKA